jgi:hypothetical protein
MTTRARLLAILKEPDRFGVSEWAKHTSDGAPNERALAICADKNARHRLKRLCEEIAGEARADEYRAPDAHDKPLAFYDGRSNAKEQIAAAILALGEDNEHS